MNQTYRTSLAFPVRHFEEIVIHDGRGNAVERWTVAGIKKGETCQWVTFRQRDYRNVDHV